MNWTRVVMNQATKELMQTLHTSGMDAVEISGTGWKDWAFKSYRTFSYPDFDICAPLNEANLADMIVAEQVFEHLLWPYRAVKNVYQMLRPNGYFLVTTPFLLPVHDCPVDCSRWTETGIKYLLAEGGFPLEDIVVGSWGNEACVKANLKKWTPYTKWLHSLKNSPKHAVVVWALGRKKN